MTVKDAIGNVKQILTHPQYKQITHELVKYDINFEKHTVTIIGKCALGEIGCQLGLLKPPGFKARFVKLQGVWNRILRKTRIEYEFDARYEPSYRVITRECGFPKWLTDEQNLPYLIRTANGLDIDWNGCERDTWSGCPIDAHISKLNDSGYLYDEIIEYLETTFGEIED